MQDAIELNRFLITMTGQMEYARAQLCDAQSPLTAAKIYSHRPLRDFLKRWSIGLS